MLVLWNWDKSDQYHSWFVSSKPLHYQFARTHFNYKQTFLFSKYEFQNIDEVFIYCLSLLMTLFAIEYIYCFSGGNYFYSEFYFVFCFLKTHYCNIHFIQAPKINWVWPILISLKKKGNDSSWQPDHNWII